MLIYNLKVVREGGVYPTTAVITFWMRLSQGVKIYKYVNGCFIGNPYPTNTESNAVFRTCSFVSGW